MSDPQHPGMGPSADATTTTNSVESSRQRALADFAEAHAVQGVAAELLSLAAAGDLNDPDMLQRVDSLEPGARNALEDIMLDAVLFVIERILLDHKISPGEHRALRQVKRALGVKEGVLYARRAERLAQILDGEMRRLLADRTIDPVEAVHQVDLQEAFDLGYDEYLTLTQPTAQRLVDEIINDIVADGNVTREEREHLETRIRALDTAYTFTVAQRARLQEAGLPL